MAEAYKRGILPPDKKAAYEEAMKRGLVPPVEPQTPEEAEYRDAATDWAGRSAVYPTGPVSETSVLTGAPVTRDEENRRLGGLGSDATKRNVSDISRFILEGGGAMAGGALGMAGGNLPGSVGGAALGYATGESAADRIDETIGLKKPATTGEAFQQVIPALATGAALEMGGQSIATGVQAVWRGGKLVLERMGNPIEKLTNPEKEAARILLANTSDGIVIPEKALKRGRGNRYAMPEKTESDIFTRNAENAAALEKEIPGLRLSLGQRTADPALIKLERNLLSGPGSAATRNQEQIATNKEALRGYYQKTFGGKEGIADVVENLQGQRSALQSGAAEAQGSARAAVDALPVEEPVSTGQAIVGKVQEAAQPVKAAMGELESAVPDYPLRLSQVEKELKALLASKDISIKQQAALEGFQRNIAKLLKKGSTTRTAFGINRTLNDSISEYTAQGNDSAAAALLRVKSALADDLAAVGEQVNSGAIAEYGGKTVAPQELAAEFERNAQRAAMLRAKEKPDIAAMTEALEKQGYPASRVIGETEAPYIERVTRDYKRVIGGETPTIVTQGAKNEASTLTNRNAEIGKILSNVTPGKDVAAAMNAYNNFASNEYFGRFGRGAVEQATARGGQFNNLRTRYENIPALFKSPTGADDLARAIGQEEATQVMRGHYSYDLLREATDDAGNIVTGKLNRWMRRNSSVLKKYGLDAEYSSIGKAQKVADEAQAAAAEFEKSVAADVLKADPERAVAAALSGNSAGKKAAALMAKVEKFPAAKKGLQNAFAKHMIDSIETTARDIAGDPTVSNAAFERIMKKNIPVMNELYKGEPNKITTLSNMRKAYSRAVLNTKSPSGAGGADTAEKVFTELGKINLLSRSATVAKGIVKTIQKHGDNKVNEVLARAFFDPLYAQKLVSVMRGKLQVKDLLEPATNAGRTLTAMGTTFGNDEQPQPGDQQ